MQNEYFSIQNMSSFFRKNNKAFKNSFNKYWRRAMAIKNGANASFQVQSKIFPKLKSQILQMRYQHVPAGSGFTVERKKV